jgi:hypothetical protein
MFESSPDKPFLPLDVTSNGKNLNLKNSIKKTVQKDSKALSCVISSAT